MKITYELDLDRFEAWSGAVDTLNRIKDENKTALLEQILDDTYPDGMTETELNDLLWFEPDTLFEWLSIETDEQREAAEEECKSELENSKSADDYDEFCGCFSQCEHCPIYKMQGDCEPNYQKYILTESELNV